MYKEMLVTDKSGRVGDLIKDGEKLVRKLEEKKFPISAAYFRYPDEEQSPRVVVVSPFVGREGPLRTYGYINEAVDELGDTVHFGLSDISVMSPSWSQFQELRTAFLRSGVKPSESCVDIGDYFLYRWNPDS